MDVDILREILVLSEKKSFAAAADELFITQSSLSRHIQSIEKELGTMIFFRNSRRVELTKSGEILLEYAKKAVSMEDECKMLIDGEKRRERVEVKIGSVMGLSAFGVMSQIAGFVSDNRDITVIMERAPEIELKERLLAGNYDFIFISEPSETGNDGLNRLTVARDKLVVVLPEDHPLAGNRHIRLEQLKNEDWLLLEEREYLYRAVRECFKRNGFIPRLSNNNFEGIGALELVEKGMGICLEQQLIAEEKANTSVALVPVSPAENICINLLWKNIPLSQAAKAFIGYMKKNSQL